MKGFNFWKVRSSTRIHNQSRAMKSTLLTPVRANSETRYSRLRKQTILTSELPIWRPKTRYTLIQSRLWILSDRVTCQPMLTIIQTIRITVLRKTCNPRTPLDITLIIVIKTLIQTCSSIVRCEVSRVLPRVIIQSRWIARWGQWKRPWFHLKTSWIPYRSITIRIKLKRIRMDPIIITSRCQEGHKSHQLAKYPMHLYLLQTECLSN